MVAKERFDERGSAAKRCWSLSSGCVAQLGERIVCTDKAAGSTPVASTNKFKGL